MKLTQEEISALKDSIEHWNRDIIKEIENGREIDKNSNNVYGLYMWADSIDCVPCYSGDCPLCILAGDNCLTCPYLRFYELSCESTNSHWDIFHEDPNLQTATSMRNSLQVILNNSSNDLVWSDCEYLDPIK